jgi:hypothetical protein
LSEYFPRTEFGGDGTVSQGIFRDNLHLPFQHDSQVLGGIGFMYDELFCFVVFRSSLQAVEHMGQFIDGQGRKEWCLHEHMLVGFHGVLVHVMVFFVALATSNAIVVCIGIFGKTFGKLCRTIWIGGGFLRDIRFIALHRGGSLTVEDHRKLMGWAIGCVEHVLPLTNHPIDEILSDGLKVAESWQQGIATTGDAMKASRAVHRLAKEMEDPVLKHIARAIGHAVATAHMADHCLGPAWYAKKAVSASGGSTLQEHEWQTRQLATLPSHLAQLILESPKFKPA